MSRLLVNNIQKKKLKQKKIIKSINASLFYASSIQIYESLSAITCPLYLPYTIKKDKKKTNKLKNFAHCYDNKKTEQKKSI